MAIKLDPELIMAQTKTSIKIKDIDYTNKRAKLKITSRDRTGDSGEDDDELISHDSQAKDDDGDDDYYEEMQLRSKLKPRKKSTRKANGLPLLEDKVETEGKNSHMEKTMSSIGKNIRISNLSKTRNADPGQS